MTTMAPIYNPLCLPANIAPLPIHRALDIFLLSRFFVMIYQMTCNFLSGCVLATESVVHKQTFYGCHFVLTVSVFVVLQYVLRRMFRVFEMPCVM